MVDLLSDGPVRIRDMEWTEFMKLLRTIASEIGRLARAGDKTAQRVMGYYQYAFDHPKDPQANLNLRTAVEDYVSRDLRVSEQIDLGGKYGHRLPEPEKEHGPRIVVPRGGKS